jgi:hypothetical protein
MGCCCSDMNEKKLNHTSYDYLSDMTIDDEKLLFDYVKKIKELDNYDFLLGGDFIN